MTTVQMLEDYFWAGFCSGIAIGTTEPKDQLKWENSNDYKQTIKNNGIYSVVDTGSTAMMISSIYFESLIENIVAAVPGVKWSFQQGAVFTECDAKYPKLYFLMDGKWIEVDPQDYVVPNPDAPSECILFILPVNMPINIFGMPLFVDYYTIHDPETGTIDYAPHTSSTKTTLLTTPLNT